MLVVGDPFVLVNSPAAIAGQKQFGTAAFGPTIEAGAQPRPFFSGLARRNASAVIPITFSGKP